MNTGLDNGPEDDETVLVTGGAGYIGSWVTRFLLEAGVNVRCYDSLRFGAHSLAGVLGHPRFELMEGDIRDRDSLKDAMDDVQKVVHLAALVGEAACDEDPAETRAINLVGTENVAEIARDSGADQFVFFSTCSSYGVQDTSVIADENQELNPVSLYAETKITGEERIRDIVEESDTYYTIFRPSTVHGPSARMRFDLIVNHLTRDAYEDGEVMIYGGENWRPLVWVGDAARAVVLALDDDAQGAENEVFNLGFEGGNYRKKEIAEILKEKFMPNLGIERRGDDPDLRSYRVDFSKIRSRLGFVPKKTLTEAISDILRMLELKVVGDPYAEKYKNA